ncbi:DsbA family protein [Varibaculum vaginae]|uniref:DsbA family protein n=1 Tax=Varibaculum vaginae TaxID=2364797 RepID=UPI000F07845C|nr:thioredoxin domain-containing protein [Varibaculum vaginae]
MSESPALERPKKKPAAIIVLVLLAISFLVLVFFIAYYLGSSKSDSTNTNATDSSSLSTQGTQNDQQLPQGVNLISDEQGKKLIKSFYRSNRNDARAIGSPKAPVTMVQFSDFSCPMCYQYESTVFPQLKPYIDNGTLRIEFNNLTIFAREYHSDLAAAASIAAAKQGKFWEFLVSATNLAGEEGSGHITWDQQLVTEVAKSAGVGDLERFTQDLNSSETAKIVRQESRHASSAGLSGTPAFFINNYYITGALPAESFLQTIEIALKDTK